MFVVEIAMLSNYGGWRDWREFNRNTCDYVLRLNSMLFFF